MAVVKIKNANGNWQNIVALKGDKGDTGERGPVGPAGTTSFSGLTDVPNRVKNAVSSVNGTAAGTDGNVTIAVSNGTVSQKTTLTVKPTSSGVSQTITGLTAYKPLYIHFKPTSGSDVSVQCSITSGIALTPSTTTVSAAYKTSNTFVCIPTGTSVALKFTSGSASATTTSVYAYQ